MPLDNRALRKGIAESSLKAMENGSFIFNNHTHSLPSSVPNTYLYSPKELSNWASLPPPTFPPGRKTQISILEVSTLEAALLLSTDKSPAPSADGSHSGNLPRIGVLNFASAKKPGGGFLNGAQAQEESIARSTTLYPSLISPVAKEFYSSHKRDSRGGYYSHSMIWSPDVTVFRDDAGGWQEPYEIDVLTSPAVNAGVVRRHAVDVSHEEKRIEMVMRERMARILFVFESRGVSNLILGSFGTGVFKNSVQLVARSWAQLLGLPDSRFACSFEKVVFGILDTRTYREFKDSFEQTVAGAGA